MPQKYRPKTLTTVSKIIAGVEAAMVRRISLIAKPDLADGSEKQSYSGTNQDLDNSDDIGKSKCYRVHYNHGCFAEYIQPFIYLRLADSEFLYFTEAVSPRFNIALTIYNIRLSQQNKSIAVGQ